MKTIDKIQTKSFKSCTQYNTKSYTKSNKSFTHTHLNKISYKLLQNTFNFDTNPTQNLDKNKQHRTNPEQIVFKTYRTHAPKPIQKSHAKSCTKANTKDLPNQIKHTQI